jgi:hypothetical protein
VKLNELLNLYLYTSNKADNYWIVFIMVTGAVLAVNFPHEGMARYFVAIGLSLIYGIFVFIDFWALQQTYDALNTFAEEIKKHQSIETDFITDRMKKKLRELPEALDGTWSKLVPWVFLIIISGINYVKTI